MQDYFEDAEIIDLDLRKQNLLDYNIAIIILLYYHYHQKHLLSTRHCLNTIIGYLLAEKPAAISVEDLDTEAIGINKQRIF